MNARVDKNNGCTNYMITKPSARPVFLVACDAEEHRQVQPHVFATTLYRCAVFFRAGFWLPGLLPSLPPLIGLDGFMFGPCTIRPDSFSGLITPPYILLL